MTALYGTSPADDGGILVTGATGTTGRLVKAALERRGAPRVIGASRSARGEGDTVRLDWDDPESFPAAAARAEALYLVPPPGDLRPAAAVAPFLQRAVEEGGLTRVVLLGAESIEAGSPGVGELYDLVAELVPEHAVLRPSWFMQNFFGDHPQARTIRAEGVIRTATGRGRIPFIDAADIAEVAAVLLLGGHLGGGHASGGDADRGDAGGGHVDGGEASGEYAGGGDAGGGELILTGPRSLSYDEVAAILSRVGGRVIRHEQLSAERLRDEVFGDLPPDFAAMLAGMDEAIAAGAWSETTDEVQRVLGRAPHDLEEVARQHRGALTAP